MKYFKIQGRAIGVGKPVYIVAEIGSNFDGSLEQAKKLVDLAKECGADSAKFQCFNADKIICREAFENMSFEFQAKWKKSVYQVYKDAEFPREWAMGLADYCKIMGIDFISSPYDEEAVDLLDKVGVKFFKIGSGEVTNPGFLKYVAGKGRPIVLSVGAATMKEIEEAVKAIHSTGNNKLLLMQCVTNYPSPLEEANIKVIQTLSKKFGVQVGYSDHTPGTLIPVAAVALGASMIEKHFTFDISREGPDHNYALDVPAFSRMVNEIRTLEKAIGNGKKKVQPCEKITKMLQRRSIFAAREIKKGQKITAGMLTVLRPEKGLLPKFLNKVVGRTAKKDIKKSEPITWKNV
jgi:N-acetylneuraminate synthase